MAKNAAVEKVVNRVLLAQTRKGGPLLSVPASEVRVPVHLKALDRDFDAVKSGHDQKGPYLKLEGFGIVRRAEGVALRSFQFRGC